MNKLMLENITKDELQFLIKNSSFTYYNMIDERAMRCCAGASLSEERDIYVW